MAAILTACPGKNTEKGHCPEDEIAKGIHKAGDAQKTEVV